MKYEFTLLLHKSENQKYKKCLLLAKRLVLVSALKYKVRESWCTNLRLSSGLKTLPAFRWLNYNHLNAGGVFNPELSRKFVHKLSTPTHSW